MPSKRKGFYVVLPVATIREIKRRAKVLSLYEWQVIDHAILNSKGAPVREVTLKGGRFSAKTMGKFTFARNGVDVWTGGPRRKARGTK